MNAEKQVDMTIAAAECAAMPQNNESDNLKHSKLSKKDDSKQHPNQLQPHVVNHRGISYQTYTHERELQLLSSLIAADLSEPYSSFTYRYFVNNWPQFTYIAMLPDNEIDQSNYNNNITNKSHLNGNNSSIESTVDQSEVARCCGCIVGKLSPDAQGALRAYIAMLVVRKTERGRGIGAQLVRLAVEAFRRANADVVCLECEVTNTSGLALYESLGFVRSCRLHSYYLNGSSAYRLKLFLK
jgi:N-alpha-acetyltransferase 30